MSNLSRRTFIKSAGAMLAAGAAAPLLGACAPAQETAISEPSAAGDPIRVGLLLPYSDIYAVLGASIETGLRLYLDRVGYEAGGRPISLVVEDTEISPDVAQQKARKLVEQDEVHLLAGVVSSGVLLSLRDYLIETETLLLCANAGANQLSRELKTPYIWRTSFTNWMIHWPIGGWAAQNVGQRAFISVPDYAAGENTITAFTNGFQSAGGEIVGVQRTPFPNMGDAAPFIAELAEAAPDLVYTFYSGGAAVTFVNAYTEFGLDADVPLLTSGFTVGEDVLPSLGDAALGVRNSLHWGPTLANEENGNFLEFYRERNDERPPDVFTVQGFDTGRVMVDMINQLEGDISDTAAMIEVLPGLSFDSPRGPFSLDANSQAPRQNMYLRRVEQDPDGGFFNRVLESLGEIVDPGDDSLG